MEAMMWSFWKRWKSPGERTWACSMRKREVSVKVMCAWVADWSFGRIRVRMLHAGLLGALEGGERHVVGAVADGVEANLEAGFGAFDSHLVEVLLVVAG